MHTMWLFDLSLWRQATLLTGVVSAVGCLRLVWGAAS